MINEIRKLVNFRNPVFLFTSFLSIFTLTTLFTLLDLSEPFSLDTLSSNLFLRALIGLILVFIVDLGFYTLNFYILKRKNVNLLHLAITGQIIWLIIHPTNVIWVYPLAASLSIILKDLLRYKGMPIFNPAALGLAAAYLVIVFADQPRLFASWWGTGLFKPDFGVVAGMATAVGLLFLGCLIYFAAKFRKLWMGTAFLGAYILLALLDSGWKISFQELPGFAASIALGSFGFLAYVMLIEPKTSPIKRNQQIGLGLIASVLLFLLLENNVVIPELITILLINLFFFLAFKSKPLKKVTKTVTTKTTTVTLVRN